MENFSGEVLELGDKIIFIVDKKTYNKITSPFKIVGLNGEYRVDEVLNRTNRAHYAMVVKEIPREFNIKINSYDLLELIASLNPIEDPHALLVKLRKDALRKDNVSDGTYNYNRVEVIGKGERAYVNLSVKTVRVATQDNNNTLKLFIEDDIRYNPKKMKI